MKKNCLLTWVDENLDSSVSEIKEQEVISSEDPKIKKEAPIKPEGYDGSFVKWFTENINLDDDMSDVRISNEEIAELETYLKKIDISLPIKLGPCETITDPEKFIESHLKIIKHNQNRRSVTPYYDKLKKFISVILGNVYKLKEDD